VTGQEELLGGEGRACPGNGHHADVLFRYPQRDREDGGTCTRFVRADGFGGAGNEISVTQRGERPAVAEPADEGVANGVLVEGFGRGWRVGQAITAGFGQVNVPDPDAVGVEGLAQKAGSGHLNEVHAGLEAARLPQIPLGRACR
jgi:hypothetical protein